MSDTEKQPIPLVIPSEVKIPTEAGMETFYAADNIAVCGAMAQDAEGNARAAIVIIIQHPNADENGLAVHGTIEQIKALQEQLAQTIAECEEIEKGGPIPGSPLRN